MILNETFRDANHLASYLKARGVGENLFAVIVLGDYRPSDFSPLMHTGFDLRAREETIIEPGQTVVVKTGVKIVFPRHTNLEIVPRSGKSLKTKLRIPNTPGTVEWSYRNEVGCIMENTGNSVEKVEKGERIAQGIIRPTVFFCMRIGNLIGTDPLILVGNWKHHKQSEEEICVMNSFYYWIDVEDDILIPLWENWNEFFPTVRGLGGYGSTGNF